jgi:hypothetical protein
MNRLTLESNCTYESKVRMSSLISESSNNENSHTRKINYRYKHSEAACIHSVNLQTSIIIYTVTNLLFVSWGSIHSSPLPADTRKISHRTETLCMESIRKPSFILLPFHNMK